MMGAINAMDYAEDYDLEQGIELHLTSNHYPPIPVEMVPTCIEAIDAVNSEGDWDKLITLPYKVTYKGLPQAPARAIIDAHHLEFWIIESELD